MNRMKRLAMILGVAVAPMLLGRTALAQQDQDFSKVQIKVTKVSGNIYMLEGAGGNIGASVGEDGIVIVDDQFAPLADKIQAALKDLGITNKPVRFVINTHYHGDHTGGNEPFNNAGSTLIAHDNVRKRLETGGTAGNGLALLASRLVEALVRSRLPYAPEGTLIAPDALLFAGCVAGAAMLGAIAGLLPAARACALRPVEAIRGSQ